MLNESFFETVPILTDQDDLNHMIYSIENRCPFLDKDLVEFLYKVPTKYLMKNGFSKKFIKRLMLRIC